MAFTRSVLETPKRDEELKRETAEEVKKETKEEVIDETVDANVHTKLDKTDSVLSDFIQ